MSDSKGAAIDEQIEKLVYAIKNDGHLNGHATVEKLWVDQILAILAQEVKRVIGEDEVENEHSPNNYFVRDRLRAEQRRKAGLV